MDDKVRSFDLSTQSPVIQFITSIFIIVVPGTLLFYLFAFAGTLIFKADLKEILSIPSLEGSLGEVSVLKYIQVSQQVSMFLIPSIVIGILFRGREVSFLKTDRFPDSIQIFLVLLFALLIIPVTSYTGMLNSKMNFPSWLSGVEEWMKAKEAYASELTGLLINSPGAGELIVNIFVVAVIPSIAEEMLFRGVLQQVICKIFRSGHIGIWITAILFSSVHLQFFGFFPRMILGLGFGYLFFLSRNLWLPVLAHFINNLIPVVMSYFVGWKELTNSSTGIEGKQILVPLFSLFLIIIIFIYFWREYRQNINNVT